MGYYIIKRFLYSFITLFIVISITFLLMHAIPGSIFTKDRELPPNIIKNIEAKYGLDLPFYQQYFRMLGNIAHLDFGMSMQNEGRKVNDIISQQFPNSAMLGIFALLICMMIGIPLGIISALKNGKWQDNASMVLATLGVTIPSFVLAVLAQYVFSVKLKLFPVIGFSSIRHAILPAIALSFFPLSFVARLIRSSMLETLEQDYIRTARAKGLAEGIVIYRHALKNSIIPVVTYFGPLIAGILTGSFVIETIFNIPGLGRYYVQSISNRDYTTIIGVTVFYAAFVIIMNLVVDIVYVLIDPRIKLKH
ncbi:MAG: ABC transporter permease [Ruminiclostridium sp.]|nr:ABC transporter permease [Ruminiclostridium sp.]